MQMPWLKNYGAVPATINVDEFANILQVFNQSVKRFQHLPSFTNMGVSISFIELDELSSRFASYLQNELGLQPGDRIAIQMPNLLQFPVALFGAQKAGLTIVNTNPLYTAREMKHQFNDAGCKAVVILANFASNLASIASEVPIQHVIVTEIGDLFPAPKRQLVNFVIRYIKKMVPSYNLPSAINFRTCIAKGDAQKLRIYDAKPDEIAFLQYTGGTTGVSKGAMLTQRNIVANMLQISAWMRSVFIEGKETIITALPMYHIFSLTVNCLTLLKYGGNNLLITNPKDIAGFIKTLQKTPFTIFAGVNTLFAAMMNHPDFLKVNWKQMKIGVAGGMALQGAVAKRWNDLTSTRIIEGYGLTETSPVASVNPIDGRDRVGTIGLPVSNTELRLIDDDGKVTVEGPGELCVRGPQVMKGYWQRPDETKQVLDADGWLKTGDIAVMDADGFFKIVDRKKDMILVSGFNVYPNEIEDTLAHCPGVLEVAAVGKADEKSGEVVKVFIVKRDSSLTEEQVREYAKKNLVAYKVPKYIEFRAELPKTNVGKILRRALKE